MNQFARYAAVVGWTTVIICLITVAIRMRPDPGLMTLVPQNDQALMRQVAFFEERSASQILFIEAEGDDHDRTIATLREAARQLETVGATPIAPPGHGENTDDVHVAQVDAVTELDRIISDHLPVLLPPTILATLDQRTSVPALRERLHIIADRLQQPGGVYGSARLKRDVLGLEQEVLNVASSGFVGQPHTMTADGIFRHADGRHLAMVFQVSFAPGDIERSGQLMASVRDLSAQAAAQNITLRGIGAYRHYTDNFRSINRDLMITLPLSLLAIIALLWSLYRKKRDILAVHLPGIAGVAAAAAAAVATFGEDLPLPVLGFGAAMLGIAVDYGIHMTRAVRDGRHRTVVKPLALSFATAGSAFAVLITSDVYALRVLGVYVVCGLCAALATAVLVLPRVLRRRQQRDPWRRLSEPLITATRGGRWWWLLAAFGLTVGAVFGIQRLSIDDDPSRLDGSQPQTINESRDFRQRWGGLGGNAFLVATGDDSAAAITDIIETRERLQLPLGPPELLLPPASIQGLRMVHWQAAWQQQLPILKQNLATVCAELHMRASTFAASFESYGRTNSELITSTTWDGTSVAGSLEQYIDRVDQLVQVISPVVDDRLLDQQYQHGIQADEATAPASTVPSQHSDKPSDSDAAATDHTIQTTEHIATGPDEPQSTSAWLASRDRLGSYLVDAILSELAIRGGIIIVVMALVLSLLVRRPLSVLSILLPPALALLWTYGIFGWLGIELTALHLLVGAFIAGVGVDDAIFLSRHELRGHVMSPILATTATTSVGVGMLMLAGHPALNQVGLSVAIGMVCCLLACLCVCPAFDRRPQQASPEQKPPRNAERVSQPVPAADNQ